MKERYLYLDLAKGVGILLIMLAHCIQYFEPLQFGNEFVSSFHVPIFFIVAGILSILSDNKNLSFSEFLKIKAKTLMVPFVIYSLINTILKLSVLFLKHDLSSEVISNELIALIITGNGTVWFLQTLFLVQIVYFIVKKILKKVEIVATAFCIILPYLINPIMANPLGRVVIRVIEAFGFFVVGRLLSVDIKNSRNCHKKFAVLFVLTFVCFSVFGAGYSFFGGNFINAIPSICCSLLGSISILYLCKAIECVGGGDAFIKNA